MHTRAARLLVPCCVLCLLAASAALAGGSRPQAPGRAAQELRQTLDLVPFAPQEAFLKALFIADEDAPKGVYGPVAAFAASRACPTAWLMEKGEVERVRRLSAAPGGAPFEYSLTLEEDCGGTVRHAVFVAGAGDADAWLKWRGQFHGRKAEGHYGAATEKFRKAQAAGFGPTAELRFLSVDGELLLGAPEARLRSEGRVRPVFDLEKGAPAR